MAFLRRRSLMGAPRDAKLEQTTNHVPFPPSVENTPQKTNHLRTAPKDNRNGIFGRVSSLFSSRKRPPKLELAVKYTANTRAFGTASHESLAESEDDIRRPSGLGSAVSINSNRSMPPSPYTPIHDQDSPFQQHQLDGYQRTRAASSPNLLRAVPGKVKAKVRDRRESAAQSSPLQQITPAIHYPQDSYFPTRPALDIPIEIAAMVLSHLPRAEVLSLSTISHTFSSAVQHILYKELDFHSLSAMQVERLIALLASRPDLTVLVQRFACHTWPCFFSTSHHVDRADEHRNTLLKATFTLAFQRMSNMTDLTLPSFDLPLLAHYTAFNLRNLTLTTTMMTSDETTALFTWLDGRASITSLYFPNLVEDGDQKSANSAKHDDTLPPRNIPRHQHTLSTNARNFLFPFPTSSPNISPLPSPSQSPFAPSFQFPTASAHIDSAYPFSSSSLLPNLNVLHATPTLAMLLAPPPSNNPRRPIQRITLNINTTLYTGLRPAALMSPLQGITHLSLRFYENIDKRTIDKVLGAAGASLGSSSKQEWEGLHFLEVEFFNTSEPGVNETLYKAVQVVLPRYKVLQNLHLCFSDSNGVSLKTTNVTPTLTPPENARIMCWLKQCPTLESISLLSGARWHRSS
ncbi:hypothetical protein BDQ12DRAFT_683530 [Crucibulum laeve]|uniref:F-box domain-containing protein n=1 Tax=Crucibulum laeve TaxID=68775 RepID=A0A5C3LZ27_9AGAR|nr:hypothetical protein BDQ12DRAFT_683530 [Crucibulum laeve]